MTLRGCSSSSLRSRLWAAKRKHTESNNNIIRANVRLQSRYPFTRHARWFSFSFAIPVRLNSRTIYELSAMTKALTEERNDLLCDAVRREKQIVALKVSAPCRDRS